MSIRITGDVRAFVHYWRWPAQVTRWLGEKIPSLRRNLLVSRYARDGEVRITGYHVAPGLYEVTGVAINSGASIQDVYFVSKVEKKEASQC